MSGIVVGLIVRCDDDERRDGTGVCCGDDAVMLAP